MARQHLKTTYNELLVTDRHRERAIEGNAEVIRIVTLFAYDVL